MGSTSNRSDIVFSLSLLKNSILPKSSIIGPIEPGSDSDDDDAVTPEEEEADHSKIPCYITLETQEGNLEQVPVKMDDSQFATTTPILKYLAEMGDNVVGGVGGGGTAVRETTNLSDKLSSVALEDLEEELQKRRGNARSDSIITPSLLSSLKKNRQRMVSKGGNCNIELKRVAKKRIQFIKDGFTSAIDMKWRYTLLAFAASFFLSWLIFAVIWYIIAYIHGDFEEDHLPNGAMQLNGSFVPCVWAIHNFASCFLFSVETQHTIGYGSRQTSEECPEAIIVMCIQSVMGVIISACMAGIVFAKLARPKSRTHTIMFSKNAVITQRNDELFLLFRVGNMRKSTLIDAHLRAQVVHHRKVTAEGETLMFDHEELRLNCQTTYREDDGSEMMEDRALLIWPITVAHKIDESSPFYSMAPKDILSAKFEIIVSIEGTVEPTGNSVQARSSYLPNEILWGYRFENMISYSKKRGVYTVDCGNLNALIQDDTPRMSMKAIHEKRKNEERKLELLRKRSLVHVTSNYVAFPKVSSAIQFSTTGSRNSDEPENLTPESLRK